MDCSRKVEENFEQSRKSVLEESRELSETGRKAFFCSKLLNVVRKYPEALFKSAQKCGSKVRGSIVRKRPKTSGRNFGKDGTDF